ncbi:F-box/kelch-repeat protein At1g80440-like [Cicer arietinum]|uniref:F-box/kelch-repeat protein At1g80440-like n=1 Tax=Cicer arietinum TaxID=3827 RepID=A0A1S2XBA9_CICAR|nr:F-box/kelch-repeat protein At1g80440-like [Cicer arietinum]
MELISGLPEDIARECLIRVSYQQFPAVASVSKGWKTEIQMPEFRRLRKNTGHVQKILVTVQSRFDSEKYKTGLLVKAMTNPVYKLSVLETETGIWSELPLGPELSDGLPLFCQIAGVGYDLVVMGGWAPDSFKASNSVFIYNFLSAKWRRGADMPGGPRTFFSCTSDHDRMVYVAGGHDEEKNALKSAFAYDVANDVWIPLPDMSRERDECKAVFRRGNTGGGKVRIVGGYCTEMQGRFERSAEEFDVDTWKWGPVVEEFLDESTCPRTCVDGCDVEGRMYMCKGGDVVVLEGDTWKEVAKMPKEINNVACLGAWEGSLLLIGSSGFGQPNMGFVLDLKSGAWAKLVSPENYCGHVQSGCLLEI